MKSRAIFLQFLFIVLGSMAVFQASGQVLMQYSAASGLDPSQISNAEPLVSGSTGFIKVQNGTSTVGLTSISSTPVWQIDSPSGATATTNNANYSLAVSPTSTTGMTLSQATNWDLHISMTMLSDTSVINTANGQTVVIFEYETIPGSSSSNLSFQININRLNSNLRVTPQGLGTGATTGSTITVSNGVGTLQNLDVIYNGSTFGLYINNTFEETFLPGNQNITSDVLKWGVAANSTIAGVTNDTAWAGISLAVVPEPSILGSTLSGIVALITMRRLGRNRKVRRN